MGNRAFIRRNPTSADPQSEKAAHGKTIRRRILCAFVALFVFAGVAAIAALMTYVMPRQNTLHAQQTYLPMLRGVQPGDCIVYGRYEQDGDISNGAEPIEWLVLERKEDRLLLVSLYALDCVPFEKDLAIISWKDSTILHWLNETFFNKAFTPAEQTLILSEEIAVGRNPFFPRNTAEKADAKVFLLSISETETHFPTEKERVCKPTPYAVRRSVQPEDDGACCWWLRTPGYDGSTMACVSENGSMCYCGQNVQDKIAVRPAMRVTCAEKAEDA